MFRIRLHGRGGQGMKTASRILGSAFFNEGFEVQDAPRYGAERRGAPIFAYVRADRQPIRERGVIANPDLVVVADDSLVGVPAAGVLAGLAEHTLLLIVSDQPAETWAERLNLAGRVLTLPESEGAVDRAELRYVGARCAGAAAGLSGVISETALQSALRQVLSAHGEPVLEKNLQNAMATYRLMVPHAEQLREGGVIAAKDYRVPAWIDLSFEPARQSAPLIEAAANSVLIATGLWRTQRPVIDYELCKRCWWICGSYCPDGVIAVAEGRPVIDYDHCKGCLVCVAQCPIHAIEAIPEHLAEQLAEGAEHD